jgi:hypothetical protein
LLNLEAEEPSEIDRASKRAGRRLLAQFATITCEISYTAGKQGVEAGGDPPHLGQQPFSGSTPNAAIRSTGEAISKPEPII